MKKEKLAINGGKRVRVKSWPNRKMFGKDELKIVEKLFKDSWKRGRDFSYQEKYEKLYTDRFCKFQGGGFADAVSSGTASVYLSLMALGLKKGSDVIVSPVTDPGSVTPIVFAGLNPVVADSDKDMFNLGIEQFEKAITKNTKAAILTHSGGWPIDMGPILKIAKKKGVKIIEDCSQSHGAIYKGKRVGNFSEVAAFSTMATKNHATGGTGGVVFTKKKKYYNLVRALADRGKPFHSKKYNPKDPKTFLFPALNFNLNEVSCAIGYSTISKLQKTIKKREAVVKKINKGIKHLDFITPYENRFDSSPSYFFHTLQINEKAIKKSPFYFAESVRQEGIWSNPNYSYVVTEWPWIRKFLKGKKGTPNAAKFRNSSFNILFHEKFKDRDIEDVVRAICKVAKILKR